MQASSLQTEALVDQYVHVVNQSLGQNEDESPWKQILSAARALGADDIKAGIAVYRDDPEKPGDHFVLGWKDGRLRKVVHGKEGDRTWWSMPREHLEDVVENSDAYLENPAKFDLDFLTRRMGLGGNN